MDSVIHILCHLNYGFWIPFVSWISDSLSYIADSISKHFLDSGIWIPIHGATDCNLDVDNRLDCLQLVGILNPGYV